MEATQALAIHPSKKLNRNNITLQSVRTRILGAGAAVVECFRTIMHSGKKVSLVRVAGAGLLAAIMLALAPASAEFLSAKHDGANEINTVFGYAEGSRIAMASTRDKTEFSVNKPLLTQTFGYVSIPTYSSVPEVEPNLTQRISGDIGYDMSAHTAYEPDITMSDVFSPGSGLETDDPATDAVLETIAEIVTETASTETAIAYEPVSFDTADTALGGEDFAVQLESGSMPDDYVKAVYEAVAPQQANLSSQKAAVPGSNYIWPAHGNLTSGFGYRNATVGSKNHKGIDICAKLDDPIYAADSGVVIVSERSSSYGNYIEIKHDNGQVTLYAHCNSLLVSVGDEVAQGQQIALMGRTGRATAIHLHFELIINGENVDPELYLQ